MVGAAVPLEVARTVLEFADFTWTAMECSHHLHPHHPEHEKGTAPATAKGSLESSPEKSKDEQELEALRSENRRLRNLLEQNLKLLDSISQSPVSQSCPPDLQERIIAAVNSKSFVDKLESYSCCEFPFSEASVKDVEKAEVLVNLDQKDPSWWVWVSDEVTPINFEAPSEIDSENYVIVTEEHVVDGIANFMAKCIASNPKAKVCGYYHPFSVFLSPKCAWSFRSQMLNEFVALCLT
ncbi:OLC1v1015394C4 [Oldenlandia corymbosa var. corymbosa]|uniref:OLC1v1015394C4 n=1 Tax=Oldenlandia corymbosa var. corymbosa TaxID=529605 RepID=A0AAV1E3C9_OLDCO|nr:OLC1v1015394C4 [Oldenlandia corymbosa var. corymbosa]